MGSTNQAPSKAHSGSFSLSGGESRLKTELSALRTWRLEVSEALKAPTVLAQSMASLRGTRPSAADSAPFVLPQVALTLH